MVGGGDRLDLLYLERTIIYRALLFSDGYHHKLCESYCQIVEKKKSSFEVSADTKKKEVLYTKRD